VAYIELILKNTGGVNASLDFEEAHRKTIFKSIHGMNASLDSK